MSDLVPLPSPVPGEGMPYVPTPRFYAQAPLLVEFPVANADVVVPHSLGRVPLGYLVVGLSGTMVIYYGSVFRNERDVTLRSSAIGVAKILFL